MDKYRLYQKLPKTKTCTFYRAENIQSGDRLIIRKLHKLTTWEEVLKDRGIALMSQPLLKHLSNILEVIKQEGQFFCVHQGMEERLDAVIAKDLTKEEVHKVSRQIIQMVCYFDQQKIVPREIRPSFVFTGDNLGTCKVAHLEIDAKDFSKLDLVELQDLKYLCPEAVLTSNPIDERSLVFAGGLLIAQLVLGRPLINADTKMNYMFQLCRLFPDEDIDPTNTKVDPTNTKVDPTNTKIEIADRSEHTFEHIMSAYDFSNEFVAMLKQMLKIDRNQRILASDLLESFELIVQNQQRFERETKAKNVSAHLAINSNVSQAPLNLELPATQIIFQFEKKPTLSSGPTIKVTESTLPPEQNVSDETSQPIIIKRSSRAIVENGALVPREAIKMSRSTKQTLSSIRRPQLTNYALNDGNLGVKIGFNHSLFTDNDD